MKPRMRNSAGYWSCVGQQAHAIASTAERAYAMWNREVSNHKLYGGPDGWHRERMQQTYAELRADGYSHAEAVNELGYF